MQENQPVQPDTSPEELLTLQDVAEQFRIESGALGVLIVVVKEPIDPAKKEANILDIQDANAGLEPNQMVPVLKLLMRKVNTECRRNGWAYPFRADLILDKNPNKKR